MTCVLSVDMVYLDINMSLISTLDCSISSYEGFIIFVISICGGCHTLRGHVWCVDPTTALLDL